MTADSAAWPGFDCAVCGPRWKRRGVLCIPEAGRRAGMFPALNGGQCLMAMRSEIQ